MAPADFARWSGRTSLSCVAEFILFSSWSDVMRGSALLDEAQGVPAEDGGARRVVRLQHLHAEQAHLRVLERRMRSQQQSPWAQQLQCPVDGVGERAGEAGGVEGDVLLPRDVA